MAFNINVENDFQQKIMQQVVASNSSLENQVDVQLWRKQWLEALKSWHSPYKCLIDGTNITFVSPELTSSLVQMKRFFEGFFLKKSVVYGLKIIPDNFPFDCVESAEDAAQFLGIRVATRNIASTDFRSTIHIQNHFSQHTLELNFSEKVEIKTKEQIEILKSKIVNNLMQWHSRWNLLIDTTNVVFHPEIHDDLQNILRYFSSFFMKAVVGYGIPESSGPVSAATKLPFSVYRSRHKAVAGLEAEGFFVGNEAHCKTKK